MARLVPVDFDPFATSGGGPTLTPVDFDPFAGSTPARADFRNVQSQVMSTAALGDSPVPDVAYSESGDYRDVFRDEVRNPSSLGKIALRAATGRVPEMIANLLELPANANEAVTRSLGMTPDADSLVGSMRGLLRRGADVVRDVGYEKDMAAAGYGVPSVSGADAVEAVNPYSDLPLGERAARVGRFIPETLVASAPDMAASLNPASLYAYIGSRTNEIAEKRVENDRETTLSDLVTGDAPSGTRELGLGDLAVAAPAAAIEALLERFTTMRLLPNGTSAAMPGVLPAVGRIGRELGVQGSLGAVEELAPYLAETVGTRTGASREGAIEAMVGGLLAEGGLGGAVQSGKEVARGVPTRAPVQDVPRAQPVPQAQPAEVAEPASARGDVDVDALLLRNVTDGEVEVETPGAAVNPVQAGDPAGAASPDAPAGDTPAVQDIGRSLSQRMEAEPGVVAAEYDALEDSDGGRILNTDVARELSPEYRQDRTRSADVHEAASAFVKRRYAEKLEQPTPEGMDRAVLFTAGGTGAGKTSGLRAMGDALGAPEIVYDTNMNTLASAEQKVEQALQAGRDVRIAYVYRDPVEALTGGAIPRAQRMAGSRGSGRTVPLAEHAKTHAGVRGVMEALASKYQGDPRVEIVAIDNSKGRGNEQVVDLADLPRVEENDLHERLSAALEEARAAGLDEALYRGFAAEGRPGGGLESNRRPSERDRDATDGQDASREEVADDASAEAVGRLSRRPPQSERSFPTPVDELTRQLDPITSSWRGDAPLVRYVQDASELPAAARKAEGWQSAEGWYDGNRTVYMVASNISSVSRGEQVLAHEALGHYGIEGVVGKSEWSKVLSDVARIRSRRADLGADLRGALDSAESRYAGENASTFARELLAVMAERNVRASWMDRFLAALRAGLQRLGFKADAWSAETLRSVVSRGARQVEVSGTAEGRAARPAFSRPSYTPEQQAFMEKAGVGPDTRGTLEKAREWLAGKVPDIQKDALIQGALDHYYGLKQAVASKGGIDIENDPYVAARMVNVASTMEAILRFGAPKMDGGALRVDRSMPGLFDALKPVHDKLPQFFGWMVARRAELLRKQGRENLMSEADIKAGLSLVVGNETAFKQAAGDYLRMKNAILDFAEQHGGTIDPVARAAWDHAEYVPFYREGENAGGPGTRKGIANQTAGIRELKGGKEALRDPLANIMQNFTRLMDSALKNRAMRLAVDQLGDTYFEKLPMAMSPAAIPLDQVRKHLEGQGMSPQAIAAMPAGAIKGVGQMLTIEAPTGDDVVRVMRNGKAAYYRVADPLLLRSLTAFNESPVPAWMKPLVWTKNLLTAGATSTPDFLFRNTLRDTGEATVTARERFVPLWDTMRGAAESLRANEFTQDLMMAGSYFHGGLFHQGDFEATSRATSRALRKHGLTDSQAEKFVKTLVNPKRWWDVYRTGLEASEMGSRVSLARNRVGAGSSFLEGAFEAKDFLDFQLRGDSALLRFFTQVIPFLNARLQGNYRLARSATAKDRRRAVLARMAVMASATAALYAWNMLAYRDEYEELEDWEKDAYWHIAPNTPGHVRIPKPFELGLLAGTSVERGLAALVHQVSGGDAGDRGAETWKALLHGITDTLAINPIPQGVKPGAELFFNYNTFSDRPIESRGDEYKKPSDRKTPHTSATAVQASAGMEALVGEDNALSPKQLEHLWRGYTGGMGMYLLKTVDLATRWLTDAPARPDVTMRDMPGVGAIYRGDGVASSTKWVDELYDLRDKAKTRSEEIKAAVTDGDTGRAARLEKEWGWLLGSRQASKQAKAGFMHSGVREIERATKALAGLRKDDLAVYESRDLSPAAKRERLDENARKRTEISRRAVRVFREAERTRTR